MTSCNFKKKLIPLPPSSHFSGPPFKYDDTNIQPPPPQTVVRCTEMSFSVSKLWYIKIISVIKSLYCQLNAENCAKLSTAFLGVPMPTCPVTYCELVTWISLSILPSDRFDMCDVTFFNPPPLYITHCHNNANTLPPRSMMSFLDYT